MEGHAVLVGLLGKAIIKKAIIITTKKQVIQCQERNVQMQDQRNIGTLEKQLGSKIKFL